MSFFHGETYRIVKAMQATGNRPGVVASWKAMVEDWAYTSPSEDAAAVVAWLPLWQVRPFYTAAELAPMWPTLASALGIMTRPGAIKNTARLANEMDFAGLPNRWIFGKRYFAVERLHYWKAAATEVWEGVLRNAHG